MANPTTGYTIGGAASGTITSPLPVASTIDGVNDYIPIYTNSLTATQAINRNTFLGLTSGPLGLTDTQTVTNKTLTSPTINGATLSGTLSGTYVIGGTPTFPSNVVQLTSTQTLTNKTLTSPTITSPTITNATISTDTITGFTTSTSGTLYGISITSGTFSGTAITTGTIGTTALATNAVQPNQLATNAITLGYATNTTTFTTSSSTSVQVTSLSASVTIPSGGRKVKITAYAPQVSAVSGTSIWLGIWDGTVGSGTQISSANMSNAGSGAYVTPVAIAIVNPSAGAKTYNVGILSTGANSITINSSATQPAFILVEAI